MLHSPSITHRSGMESLPLEVVTRVASFLSPRDLSACCAVSPHWRYMFGSNAVWKPRCDIQLEEHLRTTPCVVKPAFSLPQEQDSTLDPVSWWRAAFLREQHLWRNWQRRNYEEEKIHVDDLSSVPDFVSNDLIAICYDNRVELWNVKALPLEKVSSMVLHPRLSKEFGVGIVQNVSLIVILDGCFVKILKVNIAEKSITEKHMFFFNKAIKVPENLCRLSQCNGCAIEADMKAFTFEKGRMIISFVETNLFAYYSESDKNLIHVWDIENGVKLKEEPSPLSGDDFIVWDLCRSKSESCCDILVIVDKSTYDIDNIETKSVYYFVYNLKQLNFLPFKVGIPPVNDEFDARGTIIVDYVALYVSVNGIDTYNYRTSQKIYSFHNLASPIKSIDDHFLFIMGGTLHTVFPQVNFMTFVVDFEVKEMNCYTNNCVIILPWRSRMPELWRVSGTYSIKLFDYSCEPLINQELAECCDEPRINQSWTRILEILNKDMNAMYVTLLHFW